MYSARVYVCKDGQMTFPVAAATRVIGTNPPSQAPMALLVEYSRELSRDTGNVVYIIKVRLSGEGLHEKSAWDVEAEVDLETAMNMQGGSAYVGLAGSGIIVGASAAMATGADKPNECLDIVVSQLEFSGRGVLAAYPVASTYTAARCLSCTPRSNCV